MDQPDKRAEHEYIVARQERYVDAWRTHEPDRIMEFMDSKELNYSAFGAGRENMSHAPVKELLAKNKTDFHDIKIKTRSVHGDRSFTAWEYVITCKPALSQDGKRLKREEAPPKKVFGCTLMWWNKHEKVVRHHDYTQMVDDEDS